MAKRLFATLTKQHYSGDFLQIDGVKHYPVMYREVQSLVKDYIEHFLDQKKTFQMADCTFGGGNHSIPLLMQHENLKIIGTDLDQKVL